MPSHFAFAQPSELGSVLPEGGRPVWNDTPNVQTWGHWPESLVRTGRSRIGRVAIFGYTNATENDIDRLIRYGGQNPAALTELPGNYAAVHIDEASGEITAVGDLAGCNRLYYRRDSGVTLVGSNPMLVHGHKSPQPNLAHAAAHLLFPQASEAIFGEEVSLQGTHVLLGNMAIKCNRNETRILQHSSYAPHPVLTLADAAPLLREAVTEAIHIRGDVPRVSLDQSGGVDSGILTYLTAASAPSESFSTFSARFRGVPTSDETERQRQIEMMTRSGFHIEPHTFEMSEQEAGFRADEFGSLPWNKELIMNVLPSGARALMNYAVFIQQHGGRMHIVGDGGDEIAGAADDYLSDCLRTGDFGRFLRDGMLHARRYQVPAYEVWQQTARRAFMNPSKALLRLARQLEEGVSQGDKYLDNRTGKLFQATGHGIHWLTDEARAWLSESARYRAAHMAPPDLAIGDAKLLEYLRATSLVVRQKQFMAEMAGTDLLLRAPFLDNNVVRAAFSTSALNKGSQEVFKLFFRVAFGVEVPPEFLNRDTKGEYARGHTRRMMADMAAMREIVGTSLLAEYGIVNRDEIIKCLDMFGAMPGNVEWTLEQFLCSEGWVRHLSDQGASFTPPPKPQVQIKTKDVSTETVKSRGATAIDHTASYTVPDHVHGVASESGQLAILNMRTGQIHSLDRTSSNIIRLLSVAGSTPKVIQFLCKEYEAPESQVRVRVEQALEVALDAGILQINSSSRGKRFPLKSPPGEGMLDSVRVRTNEKVVASYRERAAISLGYAVHAVLSNRYGARFRQPLLERVQRAFAKREPTPAEAMRLAEIAQRLPSLGRVACLQSSYATGFGGALLGLSFGWSIGARFDPPGYHAWVTASGKPVVTAHDDNPEAYTPFF